HRGAQEKACELQGAQARLRGRRIAPQRHGQGAEERAEGTLQVVSGFIDRIVGSLAAAGVVRTPAQRRAERLASLLRTLISERGEASGAALARRAVATYRELDPEARLAFFELLV